MRIFITLTWDLKASRSTSVTARSAQSPPYISWHISKDKAVYWGSNMLCIKQAVSCSDCKCTCSEMLNICQESGLDLSSFWLDSTLSSTADNHRPLRPKVSIDLQNKYRIKAASLHLPANTPAPWSEGTTSRTTLSLLSSFLCQYSKHSLESVKEVTPNCPWHVA